MELRSLEIMLAVEVCKVSAITEPFTRAVANSIFSRSYNLQPQ